jgi:hypothetical protein
VSDKEEVHETASPKSSLQQINTKDGCVKGQWSGYEQLSIVYAGEIIQRIPGAFQP